MARLLPLAVVVVCWSVTAFPQAFPPVVVSRETTYITTPLTPDGLPDYGTFLNSRGDAGIALAENAAPIVFAVAGRAPDPRTRRRLGLDPVPTGVPPFVPSPLTDGRGWAEERARRGQTEPSGEGMFHAYRPQHERALAAPWQPDDAPLVAEWLEENDEALDAVAAAASRRGFWWPWREPGLAGVQGFPSYIGLRHASDGLVQRALLRAGTGRGIEAVDDLVAAARLGALTARAGSLLEGLLGVTGQARATDVVPVLVGHLHPRDAERLADGLEGPPEVPGAEWYDEAERVLQLGFVLELRRLGATRGPRSWRRFLDVEPLFEASPEVYAIDPTTVDWNELLRWVNRAFDDVEGAPPPPPPGPTGLLAGALHVPGARARLVFDQAQQSLERAREALRRAGSADQP